MVSPAALVTILDLRREGRPGSAITRQLGIDRALQTFAGGLIVDGAAVRAALTTPWSNAQAEGQITKLKLIKRMMYGRAGFDLLRRCMLLAPNPHEVTKSHSTEASSP